MENLILNPVSIAHLKATRRTLGLPTTLYSTPLVYTAWFLSAFFPIYVFHLHLHLRLLSYTRHVPETRDVEGLPLRWHDNLARSGQAVLQQIGQQVEVHLQGRHLVDVDCGELAVGGEVLGDAVEVVEGVVANLGLVTVLMDLRRVSIDCRRR
jgi:hypothetical protein